MCVRVCKFVRVYASATEAEETAKEETKKEEKKEQLMH